MPALEFSPLSFSDMSLGHIVCEIRYDHAFLIFDRTGIICRDAKERYPNLAILQASPAVTNFRVDDYFYSVEQLASRAAYGHANVDFKDFGNTTSPFFQIVLNLLEISVLTRVGLRMVYFTTFPGADDAGDFIRTLQFQSDETDTRFGLRNTPNELILRWESTDIGTMVHVVSQPGITALGFGDVLHAKEGFGKTYNSVLAFDVDYYTLKPVHRSQWDPEEWILQTAHLIKREIRSLMSQWQTHRQK